MADSAGTFSRIPFADLCARLAAILERHGAPPALAALLAANCASAERDGAHSHGLFRTAGYVADLRSGYVDPHAQPVLENGGGALVRVNACNGFAQPALATARPVALAAVQAQGVAVIAIRHSHHLGALWLDVEPFAEEGLIALACVNGISRVAPHGGHTPFYGTNPFAFAVPRDKGREPLVFDQASSAMAYGDVKIAEQEGRAVPPGTGVDRHRQPTTDAAAILDGGALLPFGGYKGSSISMMVELLAGALTGADFSFQVDRSAHPGAQTSRSGQVFILIDPARGAGRSYAGRVEELVEGLRASGQARLPGERRHAHRRDALARGVPVNDTMLQDLDALLHAAG